MSFMYLLNQVRLVILATSMLHLYTQIPLADSVTFIDCFQNPIISPLFFFIVLSFFNDFCYLESYVGFSNSIAFNLIVAMPYSLEQNVMV